MADKQRERALLDAWLSASGTATDGAILAGEAPDFLMQCGAALVGVEVTEYADREVPDRPSVRAQAALRDRVVARAWELYRDAGGPPLDVDVAFRDDAALDKPAVGPLAAALADFLRKAGRRILRYDHPGAWRQSLGAGGLAFLPGIQSVCAVRVPNEACACWAADAGGWTRHASARDVQRVVAAKEPKLSRYREHCRDRRAGREGMLDDAAWLLIVFDLHSAGDPVHAPSEPVAFTVTTQFDRVVCYDRVTGRSVEVPRADSQRAAGGPAQAKKRGV